jgi:DNA phosphorothioation-dependent restriction protein DptH
MGTYTLPDPEEQLQGAVSVPEPVERTSNLLRMLQQLEGAPGRETRLRPILLGADAATEEETFWNPDPGSGAANPHVLILGESGFGKTYTIASLAAELAQENVVSVVFDYGQGFSPATLPAEFVQATNPLELLAGRDGVDINPLQIFPADLACYRTGTRYGRRLGRPTRRRFR